jgi:hypothetical protein
MLDFFPKITRRLLLASGLAAVLLGLAVVLPAVAQETGEVISDATLQLWPEYDDPGLLVIYSGEFTGTLQFPLEVAFPVPKDARGIQATFRETDGQLMNQQWQIADGNLVYTLPGPGFHIEYYLDRQPSGDQREVNYTFETPYAVDTLNIRAQHPARATEFSLTPTPDSSVVGDDGLTYSLLTKADSRPGDKIGFTIRYKKSDQGLTRPPSTTAQVTPAPQPDAPQEAASESGITSWLPYLLIGIGAVGPLGANLYWILRVHVPATAEPATKDPRARRPASPAISSKSGDEGRIFCTKCGRQFGADDKFCAKCGAPRSRLE